MSLDYANAKLPELLPLQASFEENDIEQELKKLIADIFKDKLAVTVFDQNVLGAAHLGSLDLVRKLVNTDGLVLLPDAFEEQATRYVYRSWKSGDVQGRGMHFLRTYMQLLYPNISSVAQLWQDKAYPYPTKLYETEQPNSFLTSRLRVTVTGIPDAGSAGRIANSINQVVPARLMPRLLYGIGLDSGEVGYAGVFTPALSLLASGVLISKEEVTGKSDLHIAAIIHGSEIFSTSGVLIVDKLASGTYSLAMASTGLASGLLFTSGRLSTSSPGPATFGTSPMPFSFGG